MVRPASIADRLGKTQPWAVLEPPDATAAAAMLHWADAEGLSVLPRGGATSLSWGTVPPRIDLVLSTLSLTSGLDHCAGDLTAVVPAGLTLDALNASLGREGQSLPLDPPWGDRATIGGILATNASGPRRHAYGAPRDLVIGVEMARVDGRVAKAGGRVVKNVAGYDLGRLLCGSLGSLAVVTSAIFKLSPCAQASRTIVAQCASPRDAAALGLVVAATPQTPTAIEIEGPSPRLLIRFETTIDSARRQALALGDICRAHRADVEIVDEDRERALWQAHDTHAWDGAHAVVRVSVLPTDVAGLVDEVATAASDIAYRLVGRAALGVLLIGLAAGSDAAIGSTVAQLRAWAAPRGGRVVVLLSSDVSQPIDVWGDIGDALPLMRAVKSRFDPRGTLSPGRHPWAL